MVDRLARCGQRSVTALVDISNYVMFEYGRPSHIFDLDKIHGGWRCAGAARARQLKLLNGNTVALTIQVGVIADEQEVESLAGIMGGDATAVSDDTRNVYVEAAFWWPEAVAGRSRRFNFSTDAGHRFERGVDPDLTVEHIERITQLIIDICGTPETVCGPMDDQQLRHAEAGPVTLRVARAAKVIGMPVTQAQCADVFRAWACPFTEGEGTLTVTPPSWRFDLQIEEDLIEEVAGDRLRASCPTTRRWRPSRRACDPKRSRSRFRRAPRWPALGYQETINFSFVESAGSTSWPATPIRSGAQPDCQPAGGDALSPDGQPAAGAQAQPGPQGPACACSSWAACSARRRGGVTMAIARGRHRQPMRVAGLAYGPGRCQLQWGRQGARGRFLRRQGRCRGAAGARAAVFEPPSIRHCTPAAAPRVCCWMARAIGVWANCTRAGARPTSCRRRRCCSNWTWTPC
jgi:phenylalanyl-tRNA synthetase beta chain